MKEETLCAAWKKGQLNMIKREREREWSEADFLVK